MVSSARVVKSLNHLGYFKFEKSRRPQATPGRIAIAAAGDDRPSVDTVLQLIDKLGFDAVDAGALEAGLALQPDGPVFGAGHSAEEFSNLLSREVGGADRDLRVGSPGSLRAGTYTPERSVRGEDR